MTRQDHKVIKYLDSLFQILQQNGKRIYGSENPGVFTDARCFMDWIAEEYKMRMPDDYTKPDSCFDKFYDVSNDASNRLGKNPENKVVAGIGDINDIDKADCRGYFDYYNVTEKHVKISKCVFGKKYHINGTVNTTLSKCQLEGAEGYSYNIYQCQDESGNFGRCANNCRGVKPNSILIAGIAPVAIGFAIGQSLLTPGLVVGGGLAAGGAGAVGLGLLGSGQCPNRRPCRVRKQMQCILWIVNVDKCCFCRFAIQETLGEGDVVEPLELHRGGSDVLEPASKFDPLLGTKSKCLVFTGIQERQQSLYCY